MSIISIDPRAKLIYASIYILGLLRIFGKKNVEFSTKPFVELVQKDGLNDFDHYFAFYSHQNHKRFVVDFRDRNTINDTALNWCNVYAKVNLSVKSDDFKKLDNQSRKKIVGIGPNFGIKVFPDGKIYKLLITNYLKSKFLLSIPVNFRQFSSGYNWMAKRQYLKQYESSESKANYVFHISSFYQNQNYGDQTNELRAEFVRTCKNIKGVLFEGGLFYKSSKPIPYKYDNVITNQYVPNDVYLNKTKCSLIVFSTPAAWGCHGWKLGEYFAMGKAIISTPFYNDVPNGIIHGENIHIIEGVSEIEEAVNKIITNENYRKKLQLGALQYYNDFLKPESVIKSVMDI